MEPIAVRKVSGEVFVYESEVPDKVVKAFEAFFPKKSISESTTDVYGGKIKILRAELEKKKAKELAEKIISSMSAAEKEHVLKQIKLRLDDTGYFYLRFDKQIAFEKEKMKFTNEEEGSIQIVLHLEAFPANRENYVKSAIALFS
jgi:hypothetical protein